MPFLNLSEGPLDKNLCLFQILVTQLIKKNRLVFFECIAVNISEFVRNNTTPVKYYNHLKLSQPKSHHTPS